MVQLDVCVRVLGVLQSGDAALRCVGSPCYGCASTGRDEKSRSSSERHHIRIL